MDTQNNDERLKTAVRLRDLLRKDDACGSPQALSRVLGDRYLCEKNPLFATIRNAVLARGYEFSDSASALLYKYTVMPLLALDEIMEHKIIPYFDNVTVLRELIEKKPDVALPVRFVHGSLKSNHVLHESSHCVAYSLLREGKGDAMLDRCRSAAERFVLISVLTESFANTIERLGSSSPCPNTHAFFFILNSYMDYNAERRPILENALAHFGLDRLFRLGYLSFLYSNIRPGEVSLEMLDRMIEVAWAGFHPSEEERLELGTLINKGYRINSNFRDNTSVAYFRLHGGEDEFMELGRVTFLEDDTAAADLMSFVGALTEVVVPAQPEEALSAGVLQMS